MPELIVFVGIQGAGKSTYYRAHLAATHVHVSKDLMPNARDRDAKQHTMIVAALTAGRSVVVDNTSPTPAVRAPLIQLGKSPRRSRRRVLLRHSGEGRRRAQPGPGGEGARAGRGALRHREEARAADARGRIR